MSKLTLVLLLLSSLVFAKDEAAYPFIGINVSTQSINLYDEDTRETGISIHYGRQTIDWRTVFSYEYSKGYQSLGIEVDKILLDALFDTAKARPYIGLSAGAIKLEDEHLAESNGYYFGANLGLILYASDRIDLDVSYHYHMIQNIEEADAMHGATLALHYFF